MVAQTAASGPSPRSPATTAVALLLTHGGPPAATTSTSSHTPTDTGKEILLTPHEGQAMSGSSPPKGGAIYLGTNKTTDNLALGRVKVAAGAASAIEVLVARDDARSSTA